MIGSSTAITNGYVVPAGGKVLTYTLPLKSNAAGDHQVVRSFQFRAMAQDAQNKILSSGGAHSLGGNSVSIIPKRRPPLMHQQGVLFSTENNGVKICEIPGSGEGALVGTVTLLIKPISGTIRVTRGADVIDLAAGTNTVLLNNPAGAEVVYVNGVAWPNTGATYGFPYPRLVTIVYATSAVGPVTIGSASATANSGVFYLQQAAWSPRRLTATEVADHAAMFYRKPDPALVLSDVGLSASPTDNPVTLPDTWINV